MPKYKYADYLKMVSFQETKESYLRTGYWNITGANRFAPRAVRKDNKLFEEYKSQLKNNVDKKQA